MVWFQKRRSLEGSGWREYRETGSVCGVALPQGLPQAGRLQTPLFTPATKAAAGDHDENISFEALSGIIGAVTFSGSTKRAT